MIYTPSAMMPQTIPCATEPGMARRSVMKLKDEKYIDIDDNSHIHLLPEGLRIAEKILERHEVLTQILEYLGVDPETAENDACKIEHDLTDTTFEAIKKIYVEKIKK